MRLSCLAFVLLYCSLAFPQALPPEEKLLKQGISAYEKSDYSDAVDLFTKAAEAALKRGNLPVLIMSYNDLANSYSQTGKSDQALRYYFLSLDISKKQGDQLNIAKTSKNIGALYSEQKDFKTAVNYYNIAIAIANQLKNLPLLGDCCNNIGVVFEQQQKYAEALQIYTRALGIYKSLKDEAHIAMTLNNLAIVQKYLKNYQQAIANYELAIAISKKLDDHFMVAATQNNLGNVYALTGDYNKSLELCLKALKDAGSIGATEIVIETYDGIATAYEKLHRYPEALEYRKKYETEKSSFISSERSAQLTDMQVKYETREKENEIKLLRQQETIHNLEIEKQRDKIEKRNRIIMLFIAIIALMTTAVYFWRRGQQLRDTLLREKAIHDTEEQERIRIARDIHDDLGSGLTKINFLSEIILQKTTHLPEVSHSADSVKETAKQMIENMRDLIWALNPENTTLASLLARIREYATDYFEDFPVELHYSFPDDLPVMTITKESQREIFMVVKETLHNISKHAQASEIIFTIILKNRDLSITVSDNGIGFEPKNTDKGNGLRNMPNRIRAIGGLFEIKAGKLNGTIVTIVIPLAKIRKD